MEDLLDIQGLDHINWWPPALGWWLLATIIVGLLLISLFAYINKRKYRKSWQYQAYTKLQVLNSQLGSVDYKQILQNLSIEIRKIAMLTTRRDVCAGLIGTKWLQWLHDHDPAGFNWLDNGKLLIDVQYMPITVKGDGANYTAEEISKLITAAEDWVRKC